MKYLVLGAGPAGLSVGNRLKELGEESFLLIEKENVAGGLCRSVEVDGAPFDVGGGHFLDVRCKEANEFLFQFMPVEEWNIFERDSQIDILENLVSHPIEANIWQLPVKQQVEYLKSIAVAGCNIGSAVPNKFVDWIYWKLGERIAEDYMIPYNQKMFGEELDSLGTYWLEKLPSVSFEETLLSCLTKKAYGTQPGHAQFYYPKKHGYGELWTRMAKCIEDKIIYGMPVKEIDFNNKSVKLVNGESIKADVIITTIPWAEFDVIIGMPDEIRASLSELKYSSIYTNYCAENLNTEAHWIYYPSKELSYHRILVRHNFCENSRGYWTETNANRFRNENGVHCFYNQYAYPLNTIYKPKIMKRLLEWAEEQNVYGLGRWGEHQHYNSDITVKRALDLCERIR